MMAMEGISEGEGSLPISEPEIYKKRWGIGI
jgi:hypothetical protein